MFKRILQIASFAVLLCGGTALSAAAQDWDTPSFFSPRPGEDIGIYTMKPQHGGWGYEGIWRQEGNLNLGVRAGVSGEPEFGGKRAFMIGSEFYKPLNLSGSPLLISAVLGAGASFVSHETLLRIPLGVSIGTQFGTGGLQIMPYAHPRVAYDLDAFDDGNGNSSTEHKFLFDVDVGADVGLGSQFVAKVGATVTNGTVLGVGVAYKWSRKLVVK